MQFHSIRGRRGLASLASGAVVASALAVPVLMAGPAQATAVEGMDLDCLFGESPFSPTVDVEVTAEWDRATGRAALSVDFGPIANPAPGFVFIEDAAHSATVSVTVDGGASPVELAGSMVADFGGGQPVDLPALTGVIGAKGESLSVVLGELDVTIDNYGFTCSPSETPAAATVPIMFPEDAGDLSYLCTFGNNKFAYMTDVEMSAKRDLAGDVTLSATFDDMPNTAPVFIALTDQEITATLEAYVDDAELPLTGSYQGDFRGGVAVAMPAMSASPETEGSTLQVVAAGITTAVGASTSIPCTLEQSASEGALFEIEVVDPTEECVAADAAETEAEGEVATATAAVAAAKKAVDAAAAKIKNATAQLKASQAKAQKAKAKATKATKAFKKKKNATTKKAMAKAKQALKKANSTVAAKKKALDNVKPSLGSAKSTLASATVALESAEDALAAATALVLEEC
ncbi:hypothetical protein E8D34_07215 [Nocardioides sp. GY 10113]|uniref:hypothetical protein n=1 Tax=Nocardioides sp. GY 10113 TaxID=2569761 RepID=UPI0010A87859|nr:hypothetical protein [Nocardioides sp. GY 10113]TIC88070.1 hypothetical protein E8D34_07215 [Nocardioides sp. GY 10113]